MDYPKPYVHPLSAPQPVPVATGGRAQPRSPAGPKIAKPKTVQVKAHTRTIKPKAPAAPAIDPATQKLLTAETNQRFGPAEAQVNSSIQANQRFGMGLPSWYSQALDQITSIQNAQQQRAQATLGQVTNYNSQAGDTTDPNAQAAATSRNNLNAQFAAMYGRDANAHQAFFDGAKAALTAQQGNTLSQVGQRDQGLRGQLTDIAKQKGDFQTTELANIRSGQAKSDLENRKIAAGIAIAQGRNDVALKILNGATIPKVQADAQNKRATVRLKGNQNKVDNAIKVNRLALDAWKAAHPGQKVDGAKYQQGVDRGAATLRLLIGTPPTTSKNNLGQTVVKKANPFYNLGPAEIRAHRQDFIDLLQTSNKAGKLTHDQAVKAYNAFLKLHSKTHGGGTTSINGTKLVNVLINDLKRAGG